MAWEDLSSFCWLVRLLVCWSWVIRACWFFRKAWVWLKRLFVRCWSFLAGTGGWLARLSRLFWLVVWSCLRREACSWVR